MIARDNHTREQLNHAARERLKHDGTLPERGVRVAEREYAPGDRIVTRRNLPRADIDNGTLATVVDVDIRTHRMVIEIGSGQRCEVDLAYVARYAEHAYALTAHSAQGATVAWAAVIGRPHDFTREWAYTALSRARDHTILHIIAEPNSESYARSDFAPHEPHPSADEALAALQRRMRQTEGELLALDQHQLGTALTTAPLPAQLTAPTRRNYPIRLASTRRPTVRR